MAKYGLLRQRVVEEGTVSLDDLRVPAPATEDDLLRAHTGDYVRRVLGGQLSRDAVRRIGFPWSGALVERSRRSVGATLAACRAALETGVAVNLAGGTHHAGSSWGEGFCVFNDTAVAIRTMQAEGRAERVLVVDCDVHQGNGTLAIAGEDRSVLVVDVYGARNYPFRKAAGGLQVPLADDTRDAEYLSRLEQALEEALETRDWDLAIYVSGADPYVDDALGRLALTKAGLAARDRLVLGTLRAQGLPVAVTMAGGYCPRVADTVAIHAATVREAAQAGSTAARKIRVARSSDSRSPTSTTVSPT